MDIDLFVPPDSKPKKKQHAHTHKEKEPVLVPQSIQTLRQAETGCCKPCHNHTQWSSVGSVDAQELHRLT